MTVSDQRARPADAPPPGPEWKAIPGAGYYEASHRGKIRSVPRKIDGKFYPGKELATRLNNQGYVLADIRLDDGTKKTCTVHTLVLRAHDRDPGPGEETLHGPGGQQDNRWPENIQVGTRAANLAQMAADRPPRVPKPPKVCPRCGAEHNDRGQRCQACREAIGRAAAPLLEEGADLERVAEAMDYPSAAGVFRLAVKYGGLRVYVDRTAVTPSDPAASHAPSPHSPQPWLRRVINRARPSRQNSDAR